MSRQLSREVRDRDHGVIKEKEDKIPCELDLEQHRTEWLNKICQEGKEKYGFTRLREIIDFMLDYASEVHM